ncbi:MAG: sigma-70 family RNA polymerase sigma factor [Sphingomonadales bacterium]|nr:sigma-70 family RNA polymerase sigma factor [Sphingomonadales bacterium]
MDSGDALQTTEAYETEAELLAGLKDRKPSAYEALVRQEGPKLLKTARRVLRSEEDARDSVQEAFGRAFQAVENFEGRSKLSTWLYRITLNQCLMRLRTRGRQSERSIDDLMPQFDEINCRIEPLWQFDHTADELLERKDVAQLVRAAIDDLPETHRKVLLLRDIEELSTEEAAEVLEISPGAVKVRLHRARAALKKLLEPTYRQREMS